MASGDSGDFLRKKLRKVMYNTRKIRQRAKSIEIISNEPIVFAHLFWLTQWDFSKKVLFDFLDAFVSNATVLAKLFLVPPGWNSIDYQRWTALFQIFEIFQRWFREHEEDQRWSALKQEWSALIFSESAPFRVEKFSVVSEKIRSESALFSADIFYSGT